MPVKSYLLCPECGRKGVYFKMLPNMEDNYRCRYCQWYFFTVSINQDDLTEQQRLLDVNKLKELP